jgi:hypothetical protein
LEHLLSADKTTATVSLLLGHSSTIDRVIQTIGVKISQIEFNVREDFQDLKGAVPAYPEGRGPGQD